MERTEIIEKFFDKIKTMGFTPYDEKSGQYYFVFDKGDNGVTYFHIKECKGWEFGLWINMDNDGKDGSLSFFGQYEDEIDKFKPSYSQYNINIPIEDLNSYEFDRHVEDTLNIIRYKPFMAYYYNDHFGEYGYKGSYLLYFVKNRLSWIYNDVEKNMRENILPYIEAKIYCFIMRTIYHNKIKHIEVKDKNTKNFKVYPRYFVYILIDKSMTDEEADRLDNKFKFFKKRIYVWWYDNEEG